MSFSTRRIRSNHTRLFSGEGRFMKTSLAIIVAATSVFVFTQAADAQCECQQAVSYYAPDSTTAYYAPTTAYYAPTTAYYAPTTAYYAPTTAYYAPTTAYYAPSTAYYAPTTAYYAPTTAYCSDHCVLSNVGVLRPNHGILRRQWLLRQWLLRRLLSRRIVRHWLGRLGRFSWNRPTMGSSRVVNDKPALPSWYSGAWLIHFAATLAD